MNHTPAHTTKASRLWAFVLFTAQALLLMAASLVNAQEAPESQPTEAPDSPASSTPPTAAPEPAPTPTPEAPPATSPIVQAALAPAAVPPPTPCEACDDEEDDDAEGFGAFLVGAGLFDFSALNDRLAANGYEEVDGAMTVIGGEGHAVLDSGFVIGGRGAAILGPDGDGPGGVRTHFGGGYGMLDLGFALVHTRSMLFTLLGGIGGYGLSLAIGDDGGARFDNVLAKPKRGTSLSAGGLLTALTIGIDGRVPLGHAEHGRQGFFTLGLRLSGMYGPSLGEWSLPEGADASAGPTATLAGGTAMLMLGFGGSRVQQ